MHTFNSTGYLQANLFLFTLAALFVFLADFKKAFNLAEIIVSVSYGIQLALTVFFSFKRMAFRFQQWLWVCICILSITLSLVFYIIVLSICHATNMQDNILHITIGLMIFGIANMIANVPYALSRVRKGHFRADGQMLFNFKDRGTHFLLLLPVLACWGLIYGYWDFGDANSAIELDQIRKFKVLLGCSFTIQWMIGYVWTEFLLMTYCKFRFREFWNENPFEPFSLSAVLEYIAFWFKHPYYTMKSRAGWYMDRMAPWWASVIAFAEFTAAIFAILSFLLIALALVGGSAWNELLDGVAVLIISALIAIPYYIILKIVFRLRRKSYNKVKMELE